VAMVVDCPVGGGSRLVRMATRLTAGEFSRITHLPRRRRRMTEQPTGPSHSVISAANARPLGDFGVTIDATNASTTRTFIKEETRTALDEQWQP